VRLHLFLMTCAIVYLCQLNAFFQLKGNVLRDGDGLQMTWIDRASVGEELVHIRASSPAINSQLWTSDMWFTKVQRKIHAFFAMYTERCGFYACLKCSYSGRLPRSCGHNYLSAPSQATAKLSCVMGINSPF
jgi:hypothetical protein